MKNLKVITIVLIFLSINSLCFAETSLLPLELLDGARNLGYSQLNNYYERRPGMVDPPYVYGVLSGDRELSALFWAVKKESKNQYVLILMEKKNFLKKGKFNIIYKTQDYPRGLSVNKGNKIALSGRMGKLSHETEARNCRRKRSCLAPFDMTQLSLKEVKIFAEAKEVVKEPNFRESSPPN